jgi:predicted transcriptional regulator of viral defense system
MSSNLAIKTLPDHLLAQGRYTATSDEIAELLELDKGAVRVGMNRLRTQHLAFSPARGLYAFVPPRYRAWGVIPAEWFVDDLMRFLQRDYYVSLLSAAVRHGAAHQRPQVFQVITDKQTADRTIGRVSLRFFASSDVNRAAREKVNTPTGTMNVASRETTINDLVAQPKAAAGFGNIATIIREIGPLDGNELARLSSPHPRSHSRRLGWLIEHFADQLPDLTELQHQAEPNRGVPSRLSPGGPRRGPIDRRWGLWINTNVEPDI